jgi:hypothetical protein
MLTLICWHIASMKHASYSPWCAGGWSDPHSNTLRDAEKEKDEAIKRAARQETIRERNK